MVTHSTQTHVGMYESGVHMYTMQAVTHKCTHEARKVLQVEACHCVIYAFLPFQSMIKAFNKLRGVAPQT